MKIKYYFLIILLILQGNLMSATIKHIDIKGVQIPVIFEEQKALPILNLQLVFQNSGYIQDKNKSGLVSLSSKLLNEGTKELGVTKFAEKLEENAISLATSNGFETFVIELSNLKEQSKKGIELLTALLKSPNYTQNTLNKLKTMQTGSLKRKENDFDYVANNQLKSVLFKETNLENPAAGTIESISKIELKDIEKFISQTVCLENLIIVAGGDFELKEFEKLVKPLLETLNVGKKIDFEKSGIIEPKREPNTIILSEGSQLSIILYIKKQRKPMIYIYPAGHWEKLMTFVYKIGKSESLTKTTEKLEIESFN